MAVFFKSLMQLTVRNVFYTEAQHTHTHTPMYKAKNIKKQELSFGRGIGEFREERIHINM